MGFNMAIHIVPGTVVVTHVAAPIGSALISVFHFFPFKVSVRSEISAFANGNFPAMKIAPSLFHSAPPGPPPWWVKRS
jgi:hypothetical protein